MLLPSTSTNPVVCLKGCILFFYNGHAVDIFAYSTVFLLLFPVVNVLLLNLIIFHYRDCYALNYKMQMKKVEIRWGEVLLYHCLDLYLPELWLWVHSNYSMDGVWYENIMSKICKIPACPLEENWESFLNLLLFFFFSFFGSLSNKTAIEPLSLPCSSAGLQMYCIFTTEHLVSKEQPFTQLK